MRSTSPGSLLRMTLFGATVCLFAAACSPGSVDVAPRVSDVASVERLAERHFPGDPDYTPFASPSDAVRIADLIVVGRVVGIEGVTSVSTRTGVGGPDMWLASMRVQVDEVISGRLGSTEIIVSTFSEPARDPEILAHELPKGLAIFILDDISDWMPFEDAVFTYPDGVTAGSARFMPYADGVWFDSEKGLLGVQVPAAELEARWDGVRTFQDLLGALSEVPR